MKLTTYLAMLCIGAGVYAQNNCENALSLTPKANLFIEKASVSSDLIDAHGYAKQAIELFSRLEELTRDCECTPAYNNAYDARVNLTKALTKSSWEQSRFYIVRAQEYGEDMKASLNKCSTGLTDLTAFSSEKEKLEAQQRRLVEQQKAIEAQLKAHEEETKRLENQRADELKKQRSYAANAESALAAYEEAVAKLNKLMGCGKNLSLAQDYRRGQAILEEESLEMTQYFYVNKAKELNLLVQEMLENCQNNIE